MTTFTTLEGPPSAGKTTELLRNTLVPGRYIIAAPRVELIHEHKRTLDRLFSDRAETPSYKIIYARRSDRLPVGVAIEEAIVRHDDDEHCVLMVAHQGLMLADLSNVAGWHLLIDETPDSVQSGCMTIPATATFFSQNYDLNPVGGGEWSSISIGANAMTNKQITGDTFLQGLRDFDKKARSPHGVYVNTTNWNTRIGSGKPLHWYSAWTLDQCEGFDSVTIAAANFQQSLLWLVSKRRNPSLRLDTQRINIAGRLPCVTRIHYFTDSHRGSTSFWGSDAGGECLEAVRKYLLTERIGFWSGNNMVKARLAGIGGECVSARIEGTNSLRNHLSCALIYSSKALPQDVVLKNEFDITTAEIERAREQEHIIQFAMRGAPRNCDFTGTYDVFLYEVQQAKALAKYLQDNAISGVETIPLDKAGIMDVKRERKPRQQIELDHRSAAQRAEDRRKRNMERQKKWRENQRTARKQAGTYQGQGRPRGKAA